jgi:starch synthase (maltosyl-transferring)
MQKRSSILHEGRRRVVIEGVAPEIDGGIFPIKRARGEPVVVEADVFVDGHEVISCVLLFRREPDESWHEAPMEPLANDRWRGEFVAAEIGRYFYTLTAWVDGFQSRRRDLRKERRPEHTDLDMLTGGLLVEEASRGVGADAKNLSSGRKPECQESWPAAKLATALSDDLCSLIESIPTENWRRGTPKNSP